MIREWRENDIGQVTSILCEHEGSSSERKTVDLENVYEHFKEMENNELYASFVYEIDTQIAGFISVVFYRSVLQKKGKALVNELAVRDDEEGAEIGRKLLDHVIKEAIRREMDQIEVGVIKENFQAIQFYKSSGISMEHFLLGREFG